MSTSKTTYALIATLLLATIPGAGQAQQMVFPGADWDRASPESQLINSVRLEAAINYLDRSSDGTRELAVIRNGRMVSEGPDIDNVRHVASVTKTYTSTVLGLLVDDGLATLDTLASAYVPDLASTYGDVTLRHFATMTSGYRAVNESGKFLWSYTPFILEAPYYVPGTHYSYANTAMEQFSNTLTQIAGEPLADLFKRRIADPIGMDPSAWHSRDWEERVAANPRYEGPTDSVAVVNTGSGGLHISTQNAARLGHLFLNQGQWNGTQLISAEWVDAATSVQVPASLPRHPSSTDVSGGPGIYGYNWWVNGTHPDGSQLYPGATPGTYAAHGTGGNRIFVVPEWDMVVVREASNDWMENSTWGTFFSQIGSAMLPNSGTTLDLLPAATYEVIDDSFNDSGDRTVDVSSASLATVGELDQADLNYISRLIAKFDLPDAPPGILQSATLGFAPYSIQGPSLGPLSVWHSQTDNDTDQLATDYEDPSYVDTLGDIIQSNDETYLYYDLDVTDMVLADYAADGQNPMSAFRLQVDGAFFVEDQVSQLYSLFMPGRLARPQLLLTYVPELSGDFNGDSICDGADFLAWQRGESPIPLSQSDLADWEANFNTTSTLTASANIPEPSTLFLSVLATGGLLMRRR